MSDCIFCKIADHRAHAGVVHETDASMAFFDINPINPYHAIVIPKSHYADMFEVPVDVFQEMMGTLKSVIDLYRAKLGMTDLQVINSNGSAAQQDVFHLHFHIAPRLKGDGQDVNWVTNSELHQQYDAMLAKLGVKH